MHTHPSRHRQTHAYDSKAICFSACPSTKFGKQSSDRGVIEKVFGLRLNGRISTARRRVLSRHEGFVWQWKEVSVGGRFLYVEKSFETKPSN